MAPFFVIENFIDYLISEKRFSEHTCIAYKKDLSQFIEFAGLDAQKELTEVSSGLIRSWMVEMMEKGYSARTVNRKLASLRTFFKWLQKSGFISDHPMRLVKGPKVVKRLPSFIQEKELAQEKIKKVFTDDFEGVRDRMMIEFFYQTGIRLSELISLMDKDVTAQSIKVLGKRNKERIIPVSGQLFELVKEYRELRKELPESKGYFFVLKSGEKLYPTFVYRKINKYLTDTTGIRKKSPHVLRHTFATHMLNNGAGLEVLKELLGHANLSATQVYTHNSFAELTTIYSQSHPRGQKK